MHYFEKFTKEQYEAACKLNEVLEAENLGMVYVSNTVKFHGKLYSFLNSKGRCFSALVGSSNLGSLVKSANRLYEVDCFFTDSESTSLVSKSIDELLLKLGTPLSKLESITEFKAKNDLLENHDNVRKIPRDEYEKLLDSTANVCFDIPLKPTLKSNLNAYFGKGRVNKRGFEMPRPWYEVEVIVSNSISSKDGYPRNRSFTVLTDDGWSFECSTHGDYAKNFRSNADLTILGKWLKGRLEDYSALKIGEPVTEKVLKKYGNSTMKLTATSDPNIWLLDFKPLSK